MVCPVPIEPKMSSGCRHAAEILHESAWRITLTGAQCLSFSIVIYAIVRLGFWSAPVGAIAG